MGSIGPHNLINLLCVSSSLAVSRTHPQVLDPGLMYLDWLADSSWDSRDGNAPDSPNPFPDDGFGL